jgi:hypothetical protein
VPVPGLRGCRSPVRPDAWEWALIAARLNLFLQIETLQDDLLSCVALNRYLRQLKREKKRSLMPSDERKISYMIVNRRSRL